MSIYNVLPKSVCIVTFFNNSRNHALFPPPMGVGRGGQGDESHAMKNGRNGHVSMRFEIEVFIFAAFLILEVFWGFLGHIVYDSSSPIKDPWRRPCKTSAD